MLIIKLSEFSPNTDKCKCPLQKHLRKKETPITGLKNEE